MRSNLFCILAAERSGTSWLVDLLDQHPQIRCTNDVLANSPHDSASSFLGSKPGSQKFGFKVLQWQNQGWLDHVLRDPSIPVILQWRKDPVRHYYSVISARESGVYHAKPLFETIQDRCRNALQSARQGEFWYVGFAIKSVMKIAANSLLLRRSYQPKLRTIDLEQFQFFLDARRAWLSKSRELLEARSGSWIEVTYEDLAYADRTRTLSRIQEFLGVTARELKSTFTKLNPEPLESLFRNMSELRQFCNEFSIDCK